MPVVASITARSALATLATFTTLPALTFFFFAVGYADVDFGHGSIRSCALEDRRAA
jgi:hypothetical protein